MTDLEHFQNVAVELVTDLRMGRLPDKDTLEEVVASLDRASRTWKSTGYIDIVTVGILTGCHLDFLASSELFFEGSRHTAMERERFNYVERRITDQIARSLTDDCPTLHDMVHKVLNDATATQPPPY